MCHWIDEDNKGKGTQVLGMRWLIREDRMVGKLAPSLVIYFKERINLHQGLRMGRNVFHTTEYEWAR